jgi:hypothetical protein
MQEINVIQKFKQYGQEKSLLKKFGFLIDKKSVYNIVGFIFLYS